MSWWVRGGLVIALAALALFVAVRWPLLYGDGAIAGLTVDSSVLALMGKKMFDGRGFDIFAWGVRHLGPLTSAITAAWAGPLMLLGVKWPWPLAVRVAAMTEVAIGIALLAWATARIDRRAAALLALVLAVGPPELFRMSVYPLGHEMAFVLSAVVLALATQHVTAPPGRGWLSTAWGELAIGFASGLGWWMNKTMAPAIAAALIVLILRSELFANVRPHLRFKDRFLLRVSPPLPGLFEAVLFVLYWSGVALLAINTAGDVLHAGPLPFVRGPFLDGFILVGIAQATLLIARPPRFPPPSFAGLRALAVTAAGFALGVAPAVLANLLDWYPHTYVAGLAPQSTPDSIVSAVELRGATVARAILGPDPAAGVLLAIVLVLAIHHRQAIAALVSLAPRDWGARALFASAAGVTLASSLLLTNAFYSRYLLAGVGPLFALLALEGLRWWDSRRLAGRAAAVLAGGVVFVTLLMTVTLSWRSIQPARDRNHGEGLAILRSRRGRLTDAAFDDARAAPDPRIVLERVAALGCRVTYADYFQAYNYRLLSEERSAWIPYLGNIDQTPDDTALARTLPGRRCYVTTDGVVFPIPGDLPLRGKGRRAPTPPGRSGPAPPRG